jgi:hypothetical protein
MIGPVIAAADAKEAAKLRGYFEHIIWINIAWVNLLLLCVIAHDLPR